MSSENHFQIGTSPWDTSALELSYIHVKKVPRHGFKPTSHSPMADRLNHVDRVDITTSVSYPDYLNVSVPHDTMSDDGNLVAFTPRLSSTAFQLPLLPYASSLRLHSILPDNISTACFSQWTTSHRLSLHTSTIETKFEDHEPTASSPTSAAAKTSLTELSSVMHPNNPYVPWTPETKREILCTSAVDSTDVNSGACEYSHTTLHLEPTSSSVGPGALSKRARLSASLKTLASTVGKNLKQVAKRISKYKGSTLTLDTPEPTFLSYGLSSNSFESMDAITLSTWLIYRQREQAEDENLSPKEMTLDEYEERGSWTHLPRSTLANADHFALVNDSPSPPKSRSEALPKLRPQSASLVAGSPRVASLRLNEGNFTLSVRDREMSMPGGWTFG